MAAFTYSTQGTAEKKTAAKLEKLRKEKPEEVENLLKTVNVPTTGPPNRSQWRKLELAMKFINKSKGPHDGPGGPNSPSKTSSRPGTPNRKSITSIESKDHEKLLCTKPILAKQATLVAMGKSGSGDSGKLSSSAPTTAAVGTSTATTTAAGESAPQSPKLSLNVKSQQRPKSAIVVNTSVTKTNPESGLSSPKLKPKTSTVETNTETVSNKEAKISEVQTEVQTDANAKVLLSKKTQTDITTVNVKDDDDFPEVNASKVSPRSPRNKKKPLKKQKSLSKITNSFGKIV